MAEMEKEYTTFSGIPIKELYTPEDAKDIDFERDIGTPGEPPFTREFTGTCIAEEILL